MRNTYLVLIPSPPPFRGWNRDPKSFSSGEPGIGGYPPPPPRGLPLGPPLTASQGFSAPPWRDITFNPNGTGVGRTDYQIGPLEVAVTTGTTTTMVSTVSYHLTSLSSNTITSFSVPLYDNSLRFKDPTSLDARVTLDYLRRDIRSRHPSMSSPLSTLPSKPHSVGISRFFPQEETVNDNLPLSPAISQWLDVQTDILQGKRGL